MTALYRKQSMKPLIQLMLSLQLTVEMHILTRLEATVDWNNRLFKFAGEEFLRAKNEVRHLR